MPERKGPKALLLEVFCGLFRFSATPTWLFTQLGDEHCGEVIGRVIDFSRILLFCAQIQAACLLNTSKVQMMLAAHTQLIIKFHNFVRYLKPYLSSAQKG